MIFSPTVAASTHDAILRTADNQRIPLTFVGRGLIELLGDVTVAVPRFLDVSGSLTLHKGRLFDGASIPRFAWSFVGHPFQSESLIPSLVHDDGCVTKQLPWRAVHWGFYVLNQWHGVTWRRANYLYTAVRLKGPRWTLKGAT